MTMRGTLIVMVTQTMAAVAVINRNLGNGVYAPFTKDLPQDSKITGSLSLTGFLIMAYIYVIRQ